MPLPAWLQQMQQDALRNRQSQTGATNAARAEFLPQLDFSSGQGTAPNSAYGDGGPSPDPSRFTPAAQPSPTAADAVAAGQSGNPNAEPVNIDQLLQMVPPPQVNVPQGTAPNLDYEKILRLLKQQQMGSAGGDFDFGSIQQ